MIIACTLCNKNLDTEKDDVIVTVEWVLKDLLKQNEVEHNSDLPRVVKVCSQCWEDTLKKKPKGPNYFWKFNKKI